MCWLWEICGLGSLIFIDVLECMWCFVLLRMDCVVFFLVLILMCSLFVEIFVVIF